jgi:hypothetical protein
MLSRTPTKSELIFITKNIYAVETYNTVKAILSCE